jgi:hypothetical protein
MPFALKRSTARPKVKEWKHHDPDGDGYVEIIKYKTREIAERVAAKWGAPHGGTVEILEVPWSATLDLDYPDYDENYTHPSQN